jgi:hypothetical protein
MSDGNQQNSTSTQPTVVELLREAATELQRTLGEAPDELAPEHADARQELATAKQRVATAVGELKDAVSALAQVIKDQ